MWFCNRCACSLVRHLCMSTYILGGSGSCTSFDRLYSKMYFDVSANLKVYTLSDHWPSWRAWSLHKIYCIYLKPVCNENKLVYICMSITMVKVHTSVNVETTVSKKANGLWRPFWKQSLVTCCQILIIVHQKFNR